MLPPGDESTRSWPAAEMLEISRLPDPVDVNETGPAAVTVLVWVTLPPEITEYVEDTASGPLNVTLVVASAMLSVLTVRAA